MSEVTEQAAVEALIEVVGQYVHDNTPPRGALPDGLRLEMHPRVRYMILRNWQPRYSTWLLSGQELPFPPEIPVKINPELPEHGWRLAVVTVDVINGGVMPAITRAGAGQ